MRLQILGKSQSQAKKAIEIVKILLSATYLHKMQHGQLKDELLEFSFKEATLQMLGYTWSKKKI